MGLVAVLAYYGCACIRYRQVWRPYHIEDSAKNTRIPVLKIGDKIADKVAAVASSWTFIIFFLLFMIGWMLLQLWMPFDRYPFILLNLILSTLAALQAPIIMMSQRRMEARDRARAMEDLRVDKRAEKELKELAEKVEQICKKLKI